MATLQYLKADAGTQAILEVIESDGGVILENVISEDEISNIKQELAPYLQVGEMGRDDFTGQNTQRIGALLARSPACGTLALNPIVNDTAKHFLAPFCDDYQLHFTSAVTIGPGESAQILHRDRGIWGGYLPRRIEPLLSTIWAMTEFTKENGATCVVPGSQSWDKTREAKADEIAYAEMTPGSVLLYTGTVLHGGGANVTPSETRMGVFLHYALNWLRQQENQYLSCPPEAAHRLSADLRARIGYAKGGYVLGFYSDPHDTGGKYESVSPENIFTQGQAKLTDDFAKIPDPRELVGKSNK
jgi:hypothetical protein